MKFWEAMRSLEEGLAVRRIDWEAGLLPADVKSSKYAKDFAEDWELYTTRGLSFPQVLDGLKTGKFFRRPSYRSDVYIKMKKNGRICWNDNRNFPISIQDFECLDWREVISSI